MIDLTDLPLFRWSRDRLAHDARQGWCRRKRLLVSGSGAILLLATSAVMAPAPHLVWNATPSMPVGLYWITPGHGAELGSTVLASLPAEPRRLAAARHYLPAGVPVIKTVAGVAGNRICTRGSAILINGVVHARRLRLDAAGRPLPWWRGCRTLTRDEIMLLATARADSFDGRYFGPVSRTHIIGTVRLIWPR